MNKWTYLTPDEKGWVSGEMMPEDGALCVVDVGEECFVGNFYSYDNDGWGWTMVNRLGDEIDDIPGSEVVRWFEIELPDSDNKSNDETEMSDAKVTGYIIQVDEDGTPNCRSDYTVEIGENASICIWDQYADDRVYFQQHAWPTISEAVEKLIADHKTSTGPGNGGKNE